MLMTQIVPLFLVVMFTLAVYAVSIPMVFRPESTSVPRRSIRRVKHTGGHRWPG